VEHSSTNSEGRSPSGSRPAADDNRTESGDAVTITVGPLPDGFYVADDGPGISESERERIFDAGYSTGSDGTGLGLAIVRDVIDAHGWSIRVDESEAGGARFEVTGVETVE
jgi:signal transduction histidine kinase